MATEQLYVDGLGTERTDWTRVGTTPYLDAQDQPSHYVHNAVKKAEIGDFTFADTARPHTDTLNSVTLYAYSRKIGPPTLDFYLWDGTGWTDTGLACDVSGLWSWESVNVSAILDTWAKVDGAKLYIKQPNDEDQAEVDAVYLLIDYTATGVGHPYISRVQNVSGMRTVGGW